MMRYLKGPSLKGSDLKHSNAFKMASRRRTWALGWILLAVLAALLAAALRPIMANAHALEKDLTEASFVNISGFSVLNLGEPERVEKTAQKLTLDLSVYDSKYDGRITRWGRTYNHWGDMTCASNNPAHKNKVLRVTYGKKSATLFCNDTGGDKRLGYTRLDISGKAMKFFAPKWNGKDKGAPLLKGATAQVVN